MAITRFLIRRVLTGLVVLWLVATAAFFLFFARPVDTVAHELAGRAATPQVITEVIRNLGLNQPIMVQYWHFLINLVHGDLGYSYFTQQPVDSVLKEDLPPTVSLVIGGVVLWLIAGLGVGIISATRARSLFDRFSSVGVLVGISLPTFVIGELLLLVVFLPLNQNGFRWIQDGYAGPTQSVSAWIVSDPRYTTASRTRFTVRPIPKNAEFASCSSLAVIAVSRSINAAMSSGPVLGSAITRVSAM